MIGDLKPDLVAVVERGHGFGSALDKYAEALPDYEIFVGEGSVAVFVKGEIAAAKDFPLENRSRCLRLEVRRNGQSVNFLVVDIGPNPFEDRGEPLSLIGDLAFGKTRTVVVGDFNTPLDSVHFDAWNSEFHHAFVQSGDGLRHTWPFGIPIYTLDHIWTSRDLLPVKTDKGYRFSTSDHAWLITHLVESS